MVSLQVILVSGLFAKVRLGLLHAESRYQLNGVPASKRINIGFQVFFNFF